MTPEDLLANPSLGSTADGRWAPLPDVAGSLRAPHAGALDFVGMDEIEVPVQTVDSEGNKVLSPGRGTAYVSLDDPHAKGIHMSRLYLCLQESLESRTLGFESIERTLKEFVKSHQGLSQSALVRVKFNAMAKRASLLSGHAGWRQYPAFFEGRLTRDQLRLSLGVRVAYSSTCPCSAALARQLIQERFRKDFESNASVSVDRVLEWLGNEKGILATPHSQRSYTDVEIRVLDPSHPMTVLDLVDTIEESLQTAVQAAVKREDEQQFAKLNGGNLMFCEDAARRIRAAVDPLEGVTDYRITARHVESLHPHDAVSIVTKGVPGGLQA